MKFAIKPLTIALALTGAASVAIAAPASQAQLLKQMQMMNTEMQQLQHQVSTLQGQVNTLKGKLHHQKARKHYVAVPTPTPEAMRKMKASGKTFGKTGHQASSSQSGKKREKIALFGTSVVTGPFTNKPNYYDGHELVINSPSINQDVRLLELRDQERAARRAVGLPPIEHPHLVLSGALETLGQYSQPYTGGYTSDLNLATAKMDFFIELNSWVSGFMSFQYEDAPNGTSANRIDNNRIVLDQGFVTLGDFEKTPFFASIGQLYIPFGRYSSSMISSPLTEFIGKTKARALTFGYRPENYKLPYASAYVFHSASHNGDDRINGYGFQAGYRFKLKKAASGGVGVGWINNLGDALGFQDNGLGDGYFQGFALNSSTENLANKVPGFDIHANFAVGPIIFVTEYVQALSNFAKTDLTFDGHGAKPSALNAEATYSFHMFKRPSSFTLNYGQSRQSLGLNIPETRFGGAYQIAIARDTLLTFEYLHNINYGKKNTATGAVSANRSADAMMPAYVASDLGKSSNTYSVQLGMYF